MQSFESDPREIASEEELRELLHRLDGLGLPPPGQREKVTVEDVAEALGMDPEHVARELAAMHREYREATLSKALRELEEPLYRVERPAVSQEPLANPLFRLRSVRVLMERNAERPELPRRVIEGDAAAHRVSSLVGLVLGAVVLLLVVLMVVRR